MSQKLYKIKAHSLEEAYDRMRRKFGDDAIVLNTRQAVEGGVFGLFGRRVVEVTVSVTAPNTQPTMRERSAAERKYAAQAEAKHQPPAAAPENLKYLEQIVREAEDSQS